MIDHSSMPKVLERGVLLWTPKRSERSSTEQEPRRSSTEEEPRRSSTKAPKRSSTEQEPEARGLPFRAAAVLAILASAVMIYVAYKALWPGGTQARRYNLYEEEQYDLSEEEMVSGPARERKAASVPATVKSSPTEERKPTSLPDPQEFFGELIQAIWDQTDSTPTGVTLGSSSRLLRAALAKAFGRRPTHIELINLPLPGTTGLCTLKVSDDQGRIAHIGVRLIRLKGSETPWEVESLVVMDSTPPPRERPAPR